MTTLRLPFMAALAFVLAACGGDDAAVTAAATNDVSTAGTFVDALDIPGGTYGFDTAHTRAEFRVRHLGIATVTGRFGDVGGSLTVSDGLGSLQTNVVIDASTIDTGNARRDDDLRGPNFFDVAQYPEITFVSTDVLPGEGNTFTLVGDLAMHGVTRPVELNAEYLGSSSSRGTQKIGFTATGEIIRQDWGLTWDNTNEAGEAIVSDEVTLVIEVEADRQDAEADPSEA